MSQASPGLCDGPSVPRHAEAPRLVIPRQSGGSCERDLRAQQRWTRRTRHPLAACLPRPHPHPHPQSRSTCTRSPPADTFSTNFFATPAADFDNGGPPLLSDAEAQSLESFFSHANPFTSADAAPSAFSFINPTPDLVDDFSGWSAVPPATIHNISTTIPDQAILHGFHPEQGFAPAHQNTHFASTADDLQAASTLYAHAHIPQSVPPYQHHPNGRSHSFHGLSSSGAHLNGYGSNGISHGLSLVPSPAASNGLVHQQLTGLLPHHGIPGSVDNTITAQLAGSSAQAARDTDLREHPRPSLKRAYTYGTDSSFNESGFQPSSKQESEDSVTKRLITELHHAQPLARPPPSDADNPIVLSLGPGIAGESNSDEQEVSEDSTADGDEDNRTRKRRKQSPPTTNGKRKSESDASPSKSRKMSADDKPKKPRRKSMASSKSQRENLTEEQKRSNHILSEQKRRNLIKRGFDDLHNLVPEIRNGGLSKSGVLTEAVNFLEQLIDDNKRYAALIGADG